MAIEFVCPACGGTLQVGDEAAGRVIRCGGCMTALRVPAPDAPADAAPPLPPPPNPYDGDRQYPPSLPPPPRRTRPASTEPPPDEPPAPARPVAPRRRDPDDPYDDRPRERRSRRQPPPPPPSGRGVFFWLVLVGAVVFVGAVGCCGGILLLIPGPNWHTHESEKGKFKVSLPGPMRTDLAKFAGLELEAGAHSEGALLGTRGEQFMVIYRDIPPIRVRANTDEQELDKAVKELQTAAQAKKLDKNDTTTVDGFPARDVEYQGKSGRYTARVIVADTRVYIVLAGGAFSKANNPNVQRFMESFKITDPLLVQEGKRREDQAKLMDDARRELKEREAKRRAAEQDAERRREEERAAAQETEDLRAAAEAVGSTALTIAKKAQPEP